MKIFTFKAKYSVLIILVLAFSCGFFTSVPVFNTGNRNIPVYSVERPENYASLTFNCAWDNHDIDKILDTLSKYNVKSTFFIVGDWAEKYPESLAKISDAGHEIGAHSYNHKDYAKLSEVEIEEDIKKCDEVISKITNVAPMLYRVPSGSYNNNAISTLEKCGKIPIQWSCDTIDYNDASAEEIYNRAIKLEKGGILLMHTGTKNTAVALSRILDTLSKRFEIVTVGKLLYKDEFIVDEAGRMRKGNAT